MGLKMNYIYLILQIVLFAILILMKKSEKKLNFFRTLLITITLILCYNIFVCYMLSVVGIKSTLLNLSIVNLIIGGILSIKIIKTKEIQKYYIRKTDIYFLITLFVLLGIIAVFRFGIGFGKITYRTSDPSVHYTASYEFYENSILLNKAENDRLLKFNTMMPGSYINIGLLFKIFEEPSFKIYEIFDLILLFLIGTSFYFIISKKQENKLNVFFQYLFSYIYFLGYPLNSMIWGFSYLSLGLLIINVVLLIIPKLNNKEYNLNLIIISSFLLTFGLFFTYYFFAPVVYAAIGIFILINIIKEKQKLFSKQNIIIIFMILILPTIIGISYFILPGIINNSGTDVEAITAEGAIYRNLFADFILFMPFVFYYIYNKISKKENNLVVITLIILVIFAIIFLLGGMLGKVSSYYFYKVHYVLWMLVLVSAYEALKILSEIKEIKAFLISFVIFYIFISLYGTLRIGTAIAKINPLFNPNNSEQYLVNIFKENSGLLLQENAVLNKKDFEILDNISEEFNSDNTEIISGIYQRLWMYAMYNIESEENWDTFFTEKNLNIDEWINKNKKYLIYLGNMQNIEIIEDNENYIIKFSNENGMILERK